MLQLLSPDLAMADSFAQPHVKREKKKSVSLKTFHTSVHVY